MSKNLNRRFFYDFLIQLAKDASTETETDKVPLVTIEEGSKNFSGSNCNCNDIKKSTQSLAVPPDQDGGPPALMQGSKNDPSQKMQGSPDTLRKNPPTDYSTKLFNAEMRRLSIQKNETKEDYS